MKPILLVPAETSLPAVEAGAARAGRDPRVAIVREDADLAAIIERGTDAEIMIVCLDDRRLLTQRAPSMASRGARPVPVLVARAGVGVEPYCLAWLRALVPGLNVAVPTVDDALERRHLWDGLRAKGLGERHHLVEVDGRPALDELAARGSVAEGDPIGVLAAGAAGVLGGRMAWSDRRWTANLDG